MTLTKLLAQARKLNVPCRNVITRDDLQKAIRDIIMEYKEIIFGVDPPICRDFLNGLKSSK